ncbi:MAG: hypothetical protein APR63_10965 [Desulfuromonas sp. SDB]|nr:MAG: hypothetical protein APR63_10965 [Desulfuromonas sp. SDB]
MGMQLKKIYQLVEEHGGVAARLKLAERTGISQNKAETIQDKPEYIDNFKKIATEILGQDISQYM